MSSTAFDSAACHRALREVSPIYGKDWHHLDDRLVFYLQLVAETGSLQRGKQLVDLGPGVAAFGPVARVLGMEVTLIDDFGGGGGVDRGHLDETRKILAGMRERLGIRIIEQDFIAQPLPLPDASVDVVTCFHSLEHWHHSPKRLFGEITRVLRPGGFLILATPNAVNLLKRLSVPLGVSNYGTVEEWYTKGDPVFRGHVRVPTVRDLQRLLEWNSFEVVATHGRNFIGRDSVALGFLPRPLRHGLAILLDRFIRFFPTLCSDIHVVGRKRA